MGEISNVTPWQEFDPEYQAHELREYFDALLQRGFRREEAFELVLAWQTACVSIARGGVDE